ncbi:MAG: phage holin family protein [Candidatus Excrementavichristensenella sp.]|jgi:toxin secretion/phage lysis holin
MMKEARTWDRLRLWITMAGGWLGGFLGGTDGLLKALVLLMALDYGSGLLCAGMEGKLSSNVGFRGILKKVFILVLVGVAHTLDLYVAGTGSALRSAVICFYLSNEGLSVVENAARMGLPVPGAIRNLLAQLQGNGEEKEEKG